MRLVFITLEFSASTFSGNGIYARSQVRALAALGNELLVISGKPAGYQGAPESEGAAKLFQVELSVWGSLDRSSAWQAFAEGAGSEEVVSAVARFQAGAVLGVDWTSLQAYKNLSAGLQRSAALVPPYVFMNYRVYHRTASAGDRALIAAMESQAVKTSMLTTVLSRSDAQYIQKQLLGSSTIASHLPVVLLPALRSDMEGLPLPPDTAQNQLSQSAHCSATSLPQSEQPMKRRRNLTCCVRLSPEKEPERFVAIVEQLARSGALQRLGIVPLMCGSATGPYADGLKARLRAAAPDAVVEERFLGPADLARIFAATALNVHPPLYDAYGMTVVEAASQGAPSLVNAGGHVGAADLLSAKRGEIFEADFSVSEHELAQHVEALLKDEQGRLASVGTAAAARAHSWTEAANAQKLVQLVETAVHVKASPRAISDAV
ncbi:g7642 [Coccomyxa elongata]